MLNHIHYHARRVFFFFFGGAPTHKFRIGHLYTQTVYIYIHIYAHIFIHIILHRYGNPYFVSGSTRIRNLILATLTNFPPQKNSIQNRIRPAFSRLGATSCRLQPPQAVARVPTRHQVPAV